MVWRREAWWFFWYLWQVLICTLQNHIFRDQTDRCGCWYICVHDCVHCQFKISPGPVSQGSTPVANSWKRTVGDIPHLLPRHRWTAADTGEDRRSRRGPVPVWIRNPRLHRCCSSCSSLLWSSWRGCVWPLWPVGWWSSDLSIEI